MFSIVFSFIVLSVGMYGYIIDSYTDSNNPLIPNLLNIITGMNILPDEQSMFLDNYYIKNQSMSPIIVNGKSTIAFDIGKQQENKVSGIWFYMIMCFLPVFIIALSGVKVEKIDKNKIRRFLKEWSKHI